MDSLKGAQCQTEKGTPKYVFKNYTKNRRIGIVPQEWSFEKFKDHFQKDMGELLRKASARFQMKLILHRFGLSGRANYPLRAECVVERAMPTVRLLFAEQLKLGDLVAVIGYEQGEVNDRVTLASIVDSWMNGSIVQLLGEFELAKSEGSQLTEQDTKLRQELNEQMGYPNSPALGRAVSGDEGICSEAIDSLSGLLEKLTKITGRARPRAIARAYLDSLKNIARLE
jgi:hypothetical protein